MRKYVLRTQMLFISALQMLILGAVGLQIRLSGVYSLLGWICNPPARLDLQSACSVGFAIRLLGWICNPPARLDLQSNRNEYKHF